jgi:hypothetical protein
MRSLQEERLNGSTTVHGARHYSPNRASLLHVVHGSITRCPVQVAAGYRLAAGVEGASVCRAVFAPEVRQRGWVYSLYCGAVGDKPQGKGQGADARLRKEKRLRAICSL